MTPFFPDAWSRIARENQRTHCNDECRGWFWRLYLSSFGCCSSVVRNSDQFSDVRALLFFRAILAIRRRSFRVEFPHVKAFSCSEALQPVPVLFKREDGVAL